MIRVELGDLLLLDGVLMDVVALVERERVVYLRSVRAEDRDRCPHCQGDLGPQHRDFVESAPLFQDHVKPVPTIEGA